MIHSSGSSSRAIKTNRNAGAQDRAEDRAFSGKRELRNVNRDGDELIHEITFLKIEGRMYFHRNRIFWSDSEWPMTRNESGAAA
jgi:hypothetical protein